MKKIIKFLSLAFIFVFVLFGATSCGTSSQVKIGMSKSEILDIYNSEPPSYSKDGKKYYWYDDDFYNLFKKYDINLKESSNQLNDIQNAINNNGSLYNELKNLHFRYRFVKFDDEDKLMEFYYDLDHKFSLEDDYSKFSDKKITDFSFSKSRLEYYIEEGDQFKNNKNKLCVYAKIVDYDNINYSIDFEDGSLFKGRLKDVVSNEAIAGEVNIKSKKIKLFFDIESSIDNISQYYDQISGKYKNFDYSQLIKPNSALSSMHIEYTSEIIDNFSEELSNIKLVGYIDANNKIKEWKTDINYLPDGVDKEEYIGSFKETTYNGVIYEGYDLNPYYQIKGVSNKNNYELKLHKDTQIIKSGALSNLTNLYYLELPENLKRIENGAIVNNPNLLGIYIPSSVEEIGKNNFSGSPKILEIINKSNTYNEEIARQVISNETLYFRKDIDYKNKESFMFRLDTNNNYIFAKFKSTSIDPIKYDGYYLVGCSNQTNSNITLPSSFTYDGKLIKVYKIFNNVFANNNTITNLTIPESVISMEDEAFRDMKALKTVNISSTCSISNCAFIGCNSLENISGNSAGIGQSAFENDTKLKTVELNDVTFIGANAFYNCSAITNISFDKLTSVEYNVFENCTALKTISISMLGRIENSMFNGCSSLQTVNANLVNSIGDDAFNNCQALKTFNHGYLYNIGTNAFNNCKLITSINLDDNIDYIGANAFNNCNNLSKLEYNGMSFISSKTNDYCYMLNILDKTKESIIIPEETKHINTLCFDGYNNLKNITVPTNIRYEQLFEIISYCSGLEYNNLNGANYIGSTNNPYLCLISIHDKNAQTFEFNANTKYIYNEAFKNSKISSLVMIPDSVVAIGAYAFSGAYMDEVIIPNSVCLLGENIFLGCPNLTTVTNNSCNASCMFMNCPKLETVTLRDGNIANRMFYGCIKLKTVDSELIYIDSEAFMGCESLDTVDLSNVYSISYNAFSGCSSLEEINISNVNEFGYRAFENCSNLTKIGTINAYRIEDYAFYNCTKLEEVKFGTITYADSDQICLGNNIFSGCVALVDLLIPAVYNQNGSCMFNNFGKLANVMIPREAYEYVKKNFSGTIVNNLFFDGTLEELQAAGFKLSMLELNQKIYIKKGTGEMNPNYNYWEYDSNNNPVIVE